MKFYHATETETAGELSYTRGAEIRINDALRTDTVITRDGRPAVADYVMHTTEQLTRSQYVSDSDDNVYRVDGIKGSIVGFIRYALTQVGSIG